MEVLTLFFKYYLFLAARHRAMRQRTVSLCRRNSETCSIVGEISRSHISLNQLPISRRQMSLTQSEPDSDKEAQTGTITNPQCISSHQSPSVRLASSIPSLWSILE